MRSATSLPRTPLKATWSSAPPKRSSCITPISWRSCPSRIRKTSGRNRSPLADDESKPEKKRSPQRCRAGRRDCVSNSSRREAVYQAKRFLLDSLGCALGGYQQHDVKIALAVLDEIAGDGPATVIGTGKRIDRGLGVAGQCADDPLHGLQRHLLEAGSVASLRHFSGSDGVLRTRPQQWQEN